MFFIFISNLDSHYKGSNTRDGLIKEEVLSVNEFFGNKKLNIFPNPARTHFKVRLDTNDELQNLSLYNNLGQLVLSTTESFVDTTTLASGLYVVQVITNEGKRTSKVVIE
ncbi:T9SS type A sorting domain-containing protein [Psychroflexus torquis]|uniref:T9SS type A sorting domain-containing protein n=1 Tax=Psychroflexus torquis TaxID=57029 RepID=UPI0000D53CE7|nr:T9SS type A sorting domain-containing protein [Psychroflexus torquis]